MRNTSLFPQPTDTFGTYSTHSQHFCMGTADFSRLERERSRVFQETMCFSEYVHSRKAGFSMGL